MKRFFFARLALVLGVVALFFLGCSRDPNVRKQKYLESGQRYYDNGKYLEAAIQFSNAIQIDSRFAPAHYQLAQTLLKLQQWTPAYQELSRTLEINPGNYQAHIDIANLLIAGRDLKQAQEHTDLLLQKQPDNPQVHGAIANLLAAQNNLPGALEEMQKAIALGPDRWDFYLNLALLQLRLNQPDAAEANLRKAVEVSPKSTQAQLALGRFYESRRRFPEAEQQFRHAIDVAPKDPQPRSAMVRLYMEQGKKPEAEEFLKNVKKDFSDDSVGYRMLGDFYFASGDLDQATAEYSSLYRQHPKDIQVKKNYIQLLILKDRIPEAQTLDDEILKANANDVEGLIYRGQILIRKGQGNDAVQALENAIKNDPDNAVAHYHLGLAFNLLGNLEHAESEWREAVRLKPDLTDAQRALAAAEVRRGDMDALEQTATQLINGMPASPDGYVMRAVANTNRKRYAPAEDDVRKAMDIAPQNPAGYIQLGNLRQAQKKYGDAEKAYLEALDHDPNSTDALRGLMNTYLIQKQTDQAIAAASAQIAKAPNHSGFYDLLGTALFDNKKDRNAAEIALRKAAELDKNNSDALLKLGQVQAAKGSTDQALATYQQSLKDNPREPSFYILMGELYESKQDWPHAQSSYQKALELRPGDPLTSNNLAYVLLQSGGNVDVALSLAQTARRGMPDSPNAADTLGWVYYQKGAYRSAIDLFQEALQLAEKNKAKDDATVHYHLGLAYEKTDQPALARQHFERVLKINPNYAHAADVKTQLAQLKS
ncbi:MAG: tetratricopeptide repeat protein [Terriglobales bacterium]